MARLYLLILCWVASSGIYAEIDDVMRHKIETRLQTSFPELKIDAIEVAPMSEIYQVIAGTEVYYLSKDGRYIFFGEVLDLNLNEEKWNISEQRRQALRREYIGKIP